MLSAPFYYEKFQKYQNPGRTVLDFFFFFLASFACVDAGNAIPQFLPQTYFLTGLRLLVTALPHPEHHVNKGHLPLSGAFFASHETTLSILFLPLCPLGP